MTKIRPYLSFIGAFTIIFGFIILSPLIYLLVDQSELNQAKYFILPGVFSLFFGYVLYYFNRSYQNQIRFNRSNLFVIVLIWLLGIFVSAIPFYLLEPFGFAHAIFEATSGLSTTGLSVMDVRVTPNVFLLYRSILQFVGGVGLVLVFVSMLSKQNAYAIYSAEGHDDQLSSNLVKSARRIITIYLGYIVLGTFLLTLFDMSVFDALNHSIAAISTGGFSTEAQSIYFYDNVGIEIILQVLMILGGTNFLLHYFILTGRLKQIIRHVEIYYVAFVLAVLLPLISFLLSKSNGYEFFDALRITSFQLVSSFTTTGFSSVADLRMMPSFFLGVMIVLMLIGGGMGSTAGGIKQFRVIVWIKSVYWYLKEQVTSNRLIYKRSIVRVNKEEILDDKKINNTTGFIFLYFFFLMVGTFIFLMYGYQLEESLFEVASALGTVGLSVGLFTYASPSVILWLGSFLMFIGRLEIIIVLLAIVNIFKIRRG
jgi:trk system potassium uptake protein TrkH